jgi:hypothetical protein
LFIARMNKRWTYAKEKRFSENPRDRIHRGHSGRTGAGLGLILADKFNRGQRRRTGWVLLAIGGLTTIPLVINVVRKAKESIATAA